jgi:ATP-binding cassette, subfamily B, bacterial
MSPAAPHTLEVQTSTSSMWTRLDLLIGDKRHLIFALSVTSIVNAVCEATLLAIIAQAATSIVGRHPNSTHALFDIHASSTELLLIGVGLSVLRIALQWPLSALPARVASEVQAGLRFRLFGAYTHASWDVQSRDKEGQVQEVMTSQATQATGGALQATTLITSLLNFLILMAFAIRLSPLAAGVVLVMALVMFAVLRPMRQRGSSRSRELSAAQVRYAGGIAEANRAAEETHVFGVADAQHQRIGQFIEVSRDRFYRAQLILRLVPNTYQSFIYLILTLSLLVIGHPSAASAGHLGAVVLILSRAAQSGSAVQAAYQGLQQSLPFIDRLENGFRRYTDSTPVDGARELDSVRKLAFADVSFAYNPGRPVLEHVSFEVEEGEAIGIVGPSGAGKSTLMQILLQLRPPSEGSYLVNGDDVTEFTRASWYRRIAYVPQEPRLLHATVAENIRFFRDLSDDEVKRAAELARIDEDINSWDRGYETVVGPRADAVSGGQQQRICLARALAARPHVLVLDEPTSALDPHSETLIQESLMSLRSELTMFTIAHRMSTLDMCDRVMVILDGRLDAFDTRANLRTSNDYYRRASVIASGHPSGVLPELR